MSPTHQPEHPHLRATLILACLAQFMVILDVSVVNVALPSIRHALGFTESDLQWVVNAYTVTFAGFLLLGGRAADLIGRRRVFVAGLVLFALASLGGGMADSRVTLIVMRLIQGLGGAVIAPASLSILTTTFTEARERSRAVGIWGAMGGAGGAAGVLLGGVITQALSWRWILFINVPIGLIAALVAQRLLLEGRNPGATRSFDLSGALSATVGLSLLVFGIVRTSSSGWGNAVTLGLIGAGVLLLVLFVAIEGRLAAAPLMPLRLFSSRRRSSANLIVMLLGGSTFAMWFFLTLYLQEVRGYSPVHTGVIFLPMTLVIVFTSRLSPRLALRFGPRPVLTTGMLALGVGLILFANVGVHATYLGSLLVPGVLTSAGLSLAFVPGTLAATAGVAHHEAGLASGVVNTSRLFGGALGLAILATLATSRSTSDLHHPTLAVHTLTQALVDGFQFAFLIAAAMALAGAVIAVVGMPARQTHAVAPAPASERPVPVEVGRTFAPRLPAGDAGSRGSRRCRRPLHENPRAMARVFVTRELPGPALERLRAAHETIVWPERLPPPDEVLRAQAADADALLTLLTDRVDATLIAQAPRLAAIANYAVGVDNIDLAAAAGRGIPVGHTPDVLTDATADLAFALLLAAARRLPEAIAGARRDWLTWEPAGFLGASVHGATLGIVGYGRIGRAVATRAAGFAMKVISVSGRSGRDGELHALLRESDFVSLHCPLTAETRHRLDREALRAMKPSAILINTARGPIVDPAALAEALHEGWIGGAALDVTDPEPLPPDDPLWSAPNLLVVPHIGSATRQARERMTEIAVDNLLAALAGRPMPFEVGRAGAAVER